MATQTGSIDLKAQKQAHDDAEKKATNYLVDASNNGLTVHPVGTTANRVLIDGNGMNVYKDNNSVAFYGDTARIGKSDTSHIDMNYHSMQLKDKESATYFHVSDLRDADDSYKATLTETYIGDGTTTTFEISFIATDEISVTDSSHASNTYTNTGRKYTFATAPDNGATVTIKYKTLDSHAKAYSLGFRLGSSNIGAMSLAEGYQVTASGAYSHAEGSNTRATGRISHAEGYDTTASGVFASHAEGDGTVASGQASHAEGWDTTASGPYSHAEGHSTTTDFNGFHAHAEGHKTIASSYGAHAEGDSCVASGDSSHAEGKETVASGAYSHASGLRTIADGILGQTVVGKYNANKQTTLFEVGNGLDENNRKTAFAVDWDGELFSSRIGKILWTGALYMNAAQTVTFADGQKVSEQLIGIVLVWSAYSSNTAQDYDWNYQFIPKWHVLSHNGKGCDYIMMNNAIASNVVCRKYVYVYDDKIVGNDNNAATGTGYANNAKVLRAVIGI